MMLAAPIALLIAFTIPSQGDDMQTLRERLVHALLPTTAQQARDIAGAARKLADSMKPDGSWPDIDYADRTPGPWKTSEHLSRVETMARAYRAPDSGAAGDPHLRDAIRLALGRWVQQDYQNPNWWHNQIGVPKSIGEILLLMGSEAPPDQAQGGIAIMKRSTWAAWTGENLVWGATIQVMRGLVEGSGDTVREAFDGIYHEVKIARIGQEGVQADFSFHQHGPLLYNGGYGLGFSDDVAHFVWLARGTRFACPPDRMAIITSYLLDGQQWMVQDGIFDYSAVGREITRPGKSAGGLARAATELAETPGPRRAELRTFAARLRGEAGAAPVTGNRHYWRADFMAHRRAAYYVSVRGFSKRTANTDGFINGENKRSHHLADGAMFLYKTGQEYRDIFPAWDWRRIPGTTVQQVSEPFDPRKVHAMGSTTFVGGVSDGLYGLSVMDLRRGELSAHKAWACLDDRVVCLGAAITCPASDPVATTVEQCLSRGPALTDGRREANGQVSGATWAFHGGVGYLLLEPARVHLTDGPQTGAWSDIGTGSSRPVTREVFCLWIDHGPSPASASYRYAVVPNTTAEGLKTMAALPPAERPQALSNTPALQAVLDPRQSALFAAFWQAGSVEGWQRGAVAADQPCLVLLRLDRGRLVAAASNPNAEALTVNVDVPGRWDGEGCSALPGGRTRIRFALPGGVDGGRSVVKRLTAARA